MAHNGAPGVLLHQQRDSPTRVDEITDRLITAIAIGEYLPGARLPVERDLAASLGAGRMTVRAALARLVERGLLETRRGRCDAICRLQGTVCRAAAESRSTHDVAVLNARFDAYRTAESGLGAQQADSQFHLAIMDAAHNEVLKQLLLDLKATVSIGSPAHLWGEPTTMRSMELRALREHEQLVQAIADGRGDDADELARHHGAIDFELITTAMRRAGVLID